MIRVVYDTVGKRRNHACAALCLAWSLWSVAAHAVLEPAPHDAQAPVVLVADELHYDEKTDIITATGNVEISQGPRIMLADRVRYDQAHNLVFAEGHISMLESTGEVVFADQLELKDDLKTGVVEQFQARLSDNSLFAAREGRRVSETVTKLKRAVYSPCRVHCSDGAPTTPLWQMSASRVTIDEAAETVYYRNAWMEVEGVPMLYTPYFSHPTPGASNKSGLLTPEYRHSSNLGDMYKIPVYFALSPDYDLTLIPTITSEEGVVMGAEYRQLFDTGKLSATGSYTRPEDRDPLGNPSAGVANRGHLFADGRFDPDSSWAWGFSIRRTTDDTYLRRYGYNDDPLLTSRIFAESTGLSPFAGRNYASVQALSFQGITINDDPNRSPLVLPLASLDYETNPLAYDARAHFNANMMSLTRSVGADSNRLSLSGGISAPYITEGGHWFDVTADLRTDMYVVRDVVLAGGRTFDGATGRVIPEASFGWKYPLINRFTSSSLIIEPTIRAIVSPHAGNPLKIPNEDSAVPEFTDVNLFATNRFAGYDRVESGPRMNYGLRSTYTTNQNRTVSALIGQTYRTENDPLFPISNDLSSHFSDYVGRVGYSGAMFDTSYRFRLDKDTFSQKRSELDGTVNLGRVSLGGTYLRINNDPVLGDKEEVAGSVGVQVTKEWNINTYGRQDLAKNVFTGGGVNVMFQNECLMLLTNIDRQNTSDRDFQESTNISVRVGFKNLN